MTVSEKELLLKTDLKVRIDPNDFMTLLLHYFLSQFITLPKGIAAAQCATPVEVIKVPREDFVKYVSSSPETKLSVKHKWQARALTQAKKLPEEDVIEYFNSLDLDKDG